MQVKKYLSRKGSSDPNTSVVKGGPKDGSTQGRRKDLKTVQKRGTVDGEYVVAKGGPTEGEHSGEKGGPADREHSGTLLTGLMSRCRKPTE